MARSDRRSFCYTLEVFEPEKDRWTVWGLYFRKQDFQRNKAALMQQGMRIRACAWKRREMRKAASHGE